VRSWRKGSTLSRRLLLQSKEPLELSDLAFSVTLGKKLSEYQTNPQHVKAAKMLKARGVNIGIGDIIKYVVTKDGVKPLELVTWKDVNFDKYVEYAKSMFEQLLDALDMNFDTIIGKPAQTSLEKWFEDGET